MYFLSNFQNFQNFLQTQPRLSTIFFVAMKVLLLTFLAHSDKRTCSAVPSAQEENYGFRKNKQGSLAYTGKQPRQSPSVRASVWRKTGGKWLQRFFAVPENYCNPQFVVTAMRHARNFSGKQCIAVRKYCGLLNSFRTGMHCWRTWCTLGAFQERTT